MAQPPSTLQQAINNAARKYGVPAATLTGIWQIESGGNDPNNFVNRSGYGGLFGTSGKAIGPYDAAGNAPAAYGSESQQANTAASILSNLLQKSGGNMATALSEYSGGGYSSVPGAGSGGIPVPSSAPTSLGGSSTLTVQPAGGHGGSGGGSLWSHILGDAEHAAESVWGDVVGGAESLITGPVAFLKAAMWLLNPVTWLRAVETTIGMVLILAGVLVALGADRAIGKVPGPTKALEAAAAE